MRKKQLLTLLSTATFTAFAALSVPMTAVVAAPAAEAKAAAKTKFANNAYIVRLTEMPVVAYDGSIKGYPATKPRPGQKIDPDSPLVVSYKSYLESRQDAVLASVGGGKKLYSYGYAFNGFAAELTAAQAGKLAATRGVVTVEKDAARQLDTSSTPTSSGWLAPMASGPRPEPRARTSSSASSMAACGRSIRAFRIARARTATTRGTASWITSRSRLARQVRPGEAFTATNCNQKLIGARYYNSGFGGNAGIKVALPYEFNSRATRRPRHAYFQHLGRNANVTVTGPARCSATSAASHLARASRRTRSAGATAMTAAASIRTASRPSTRPSRTAWT